MRLLVIVFVSLVLAVPGKSQILFGGKAGVNVTTLGTSSRYKPRLGYHAGLFYSQHLEAQYGWQIGLQYSLQGARDAATTNGRLSYHYLSMPIVLKLFFKESVYAEIGPEVAYLLGAKYKEQGFEEPRSSVVRNWDLLGVIGFGHETDSGTNLGLRFGVGFLNTNGGQPGNSVVFRNLVFQAHAGFRIKEID